MGQELQHAACYKLINYYKYRKSCRAIYFENLKRIHLVSALAHSFFFFLYPIYFFPFKTLYYVIAHEIYLTSPLGYNF